MSKSFAGQSITCFNDIPMSAAGVAAWMGISARRVRQLAAAGRIAWMYKESTTGEWRVKENVVSPSVMPGKRGPKMGSWKRRVKRKRSHLWVAK